MKLLDGLFWAGAALLVANLWNVEKATLLYAWFVLFVFLVKLIKALDESVRELRQEWRKRRQHRA